MFETAREIFDRILEHELGQTVIIGSAFAVLIAGLVYA